MKKSTRRVLLAALVAVFLGSAAAQDPAAPYVDPYADALAAMDFAALREVNPDILGWILIPNTRVSYPFLQGTDNDYYLRRTWRKGSSAVGAIFVEACNSGDLTDFNTVIYGHNMNNDNMIIKIKKYKDLSYFQKHPYVYITSDAGSARYEIFAAYPHSSEHLLLCYDFDDPDQFSDYFASLDGTVNANYRRDRFPEFGDKVLTLSTCYKQNRQQRYLVQGVLTEQFTVLKK